MARLNSESFTLFESTIAATGNTFAFDGETSVDCMRTLLGVIGDMGLDPMVSADLNKGMMFLFDIEIINMPDLANGRYILAPNHVSDLDAMILGLLHPGIRIVSKSAWTENVMLRQFLSRHYDLRGLDRTSMASLRSLLAETIRYFQEGGDGRHFLVFSQGTISDFNRNSPERVSTIAQQVSLKTGVPIVPVFIEQVSLCRPTRIVFDAPRTVARGEDFRALWLEREAALQASLTPPARMPRLSEKHANNNRPGDPFF